MTGPSLSAISSWALVINSKKQAQEGFDTLFEKHIVRRLVLGRGCSKT